MSNSCESGGRIIREDVRKAYTAEIGVRELTDRNDGVRVQQYLKSSGLQGNYAWCAAFVNFIYKECGVTERARPSAQARRWFERKDKLVEWKYVQPGDVFGLWYRRLNRIGHIGFIDEVRDNSVVTVEGNTNEAGSREGNGVWRKVRMKRTIYKTANWID